MLQDILGLPMTGSALLAGAAYAGLSLFATGPLVAERTIDKSGWPQHCARQGRVVVTPPVLPSRPGFDCSAIIGTIYGREGAAFCSRYGDTLTLPLSILETLAGQPAQAARRRAEERANQAQSACSCAVGVVIENRRVDFAIHAGTARLITPVPVRRLADELDRARSSSACNVKE